METCQPPSSCEAAALDHFINGLDEGTETLLDLLMIQLLVDKDGFQELF